MMATALAAVCPTDALCVPVLILWAFPEPAVVAAGVPPVQGPGQRYHLGAGRV